MKYQANIQLSTMSKFLCRLLLEISSVDHKAVENMIIDIGVDINNEPHTAPTIEEGFDISHKNGKYEVFEDLSK